jgi:molybdate transport system ATP-binding protein
VRFRALHQAYGLLSLQLPGSSISLQLAHGPLALGKSVRIKVKPAM